MGSYVAVPSNQIHIDSMFTEIQDTIAYTRDFADEMRIELSEGIENLNAVVGTYKPTIEEINTSVPEINAPVFPTKPVFAPLNFDDGWPTDVALPPNFMDYGEMDFTFIAPNAPDEIDGNFDWSATEYTSAMWIDLFTKVHENILNGGTGLSDSIHAIIIAREQYARKANQDREYRRALASVGNKGFNLPSGQIAALQRDVITEILSKDQDALNNILIKDFDLATENTRFAITTGADLEKLLRVTYESAEQRGFEAKKAAKEYLISVYNANIQAYMSKWEGIKIRLTALKTKIDGITSYNDGLVKIYLGKAQVFEVKINAIVAKNTGLIDARKGDISIYSSEVQAVATEYGALLDEVKVKMDGIRLNITSTIEEEKLKLSAYSDKAKLTETVAEAVSNISAQSVASALGAINTSLSNGYTGNESRSEGWHHGESLGETHSYTEG